MSDKAGSPGRGGEAPQAAVAPASSEQKSPQREATQSPGKAGQGSPEQKSPGRGSTGGGAVESELAADVVEVDDVSLFAQGLSFGACD